MTVYSFQIEGHSTDYLRITTNEDHCDGGNTYGIILNPINNDVVAAIGDSYPDCP